MTFDCAVVRLAKSLGTPFYVTGLIWQCAGCWTQMNGNHRLDGIGDGRRLYWTFLRRHLFGGFAAAKRRPPPTAAAGAPRDPSDEAVSICTRSAARPPATPTARPRRVVPGVTSRRSICCGDKLRGSPRAANSVDTSTVLRPRLTASIVMALPVRLLQPSLLEKGTNVETPAILDFCRPELRRCRLGRLGDTSCTVLPAASAY